VRLPKWAIPLPAIILSFFPISAKAEPIQGLNAVGYSVSAIPPIQSDTEYPTCGSELENNINRNFNGEPFQQCPVDLFMIHYTGFITVPANNTIQFMVAADDGGVIGLGNTEFGTWNDKHCSWSAATTAAFPAATYALDGWFYEHGGSTCFMLAWNINGAGWEIVPDSAFTSSSSPTTTTTSSSTSSTTSSSTSSSTSTTTTTTSSSIPSTTSSTEIVATTTSSSQPVQTSAETTTSSSTTTTQISTTTTTTTTTTLAPAPTTTATPYTPPQTTTTVEFVTVGPVSPVPNTTVPELVEDTVPKLPEETVPETTVLDETFVATIVPENTVLVPIEESQEEDIKDTATAEQPTYLDMLDEEPITDAVVNVPLDASGTLLEGDSADYDEVVAEKLFESLEEIKTDEKINNELFVEILDTLNSQDIPVEKIVQIVDAILNTDLSETQVQSIVSSPEIIENVNVEQAEELFSLVNEDVLTEEQGLEIVNAVQNAPAKIRKVFESAINVFGGVFDNYVPVNSKIPVGTRRTLIAASTVLFTVPVSAGKRN